MDLLPHIKELVKLQNDLLQEFSKQLCPTHMDQEGNLSIFARKELASDVSVTGHNWTQKFHGYGVSFTRESDGVIVDFDKHLDKPNNFSSWRLTLYLESLGIDVEHEELTKMLNALPLNKTHNDRFELSNNYVT